MDLIKKDDLIKYVSLDDKRSMSVCIVLSDICNLTCQYCTENGRTHPWVDLEKLKHLIKKIVSVYTWKKSRRYIILGGEPTVWPELREFCKFLKEIDSLSIITLLTNGTRTSRYWKKISPYIDEVICSIHVSQVDVEKINENLKVLIENNVHTVAQILMDINHWDKAVSDAEWMITNGWANYTVLKPVETMLGSETLQPYTQEQLSYIENWSNDIASSRNEIVTKFQTKILDKSNLDNYGFITNNNQTISLMHTTIASKGWDSVPNWHCFLDFDKLSIHYNGTVKSGDSCLQGTIFGNFLKSDPNTWDWKMKPIVCQYQRCLCVSDFETHKFKFKQDADHHLQSIKNNVT